MLWVLSLLPSLLTAFTFQRGTELASVKPFTLPPPPPEQNGCTFTKNQDEYEVTWCNNGIFITTNVLSVCSSGIVQFENHSVVIHASTVFLDCDITSSLNLWIYALKIVPSPGIKIDVSQHTKCPVPVPGDVPTTFGTTGETGSYGLHGKRGGTVMMIAEDIKYDPEHPMVIRSNGGDGCDGGDGGGGSIGEKGHDSKHCDQTPSRGEKGGNGGRAGPGGNGGDGGDIQIISQNSMPAGAVVFEMSPGLAGTTGEPGLPAEGGVGGSKFCKSWHTGAFGHSKHHCCSPGDKDARPGSPGQIAEPAQYVPRVGNVGTFTYDVLNNTHYLMLSPLSAKFSLTQADNEYRDGNIEEARDQYSALIMSLRREIIELNTAANSTNVTMSVSAEVDSYEAILDVAESKLAQIKHALNFYGDASDWCPPFFPSYYERTLMKLLDGLEVIETKYLTLKHDAEDLDTQEAIFRSTMGHVDDQILQSQSTIDTLAIEAQQQSVLANQVLLEMEYMERNISHDNYECHNAIEEKSWGFSFKDLVHICEIAIDVGRLVAGDGTGILSLGGDIKQIISAAKEINIDLKHIGTMVDSFHDITVAVKDTTSDIKAIKDAYSKIEAQIDDIANRDSAKIFASSDSLDKLMKEFGDIAACRHLYDDFQTLYAMGQSRNRMILLHDKYRVAIMKELASIGYYVTQKELAMQSLASIENPHLFDRLRFMEDAYMYMKDIVARAVSTYHDSFKCNALTSSSLAITTTSHATLTFSKLLIDIKIEDKMEKWSQIATPFYVGNMAIYKRRHSDPDLFKALDTSREMHFNLHLGMQPFIGMSNLRLADMRVVFPGIQTASGLLRVKVTKLGYTSNRCEYGRVWSLTSPDEVKLVTTDLQGNLVADTTESRGDMIESTTKSFNYRSPIGGYIVEVNSLLNPGLNTENVHAMEVKLRGYSLSMQSIDDTVRPIDGGTVNGTYQPFCQLENGAEVCMVTTRSTVSSDSSHEDTHHVTALGWAMISVGCFFGVVLVLSVGYYARKRSSDADADNDSSLFEKLRDACIASPNQWHSDLNE